MDTMGESLAKAPRADGYGKYQEVLKQPKRVRRGWGRKNMRQNYKNKIYEKVFSIFGTNANGLLGKLDSLKSNIAFFNTPTCINIQETKLIFPGQVKLDGYQIFETVRTGMGGGLLTAVRQDIEPVLILTGTENIEMIVVQGKIGKYNVRIFNYYGLQENNQSQRLKAEQGNS